VEQKFRAYLHVLGTDSSKDPAVFGYGVSPAIPVKPTDFILVETYPSSRYAVGVIVSAWPNGACYIEPITDLGKTNSEWQKVADFSDDVSGDAVHGDDFYLLTFKDTPRFKVLRTDARKPDLASAETVVPPGQAVITGIHAAQDALYVELLDGGFNRVLRVPYGPKPKVEEVSLPFKGTVDVETDPCLPGATLGMVSWTKAYTIPLRSQDEPDDRHPIFSARGPTTTIPPTSSPSK
jgi:prolyl oligopeptidase